MNEYFQIGRNLVFLCIITILFSCEKPKKYSDIPQIEYKSHRSGIGIDQLGNEVKFIELTFHFIDGDGDIGLNDSDTTSPYTGKYSSNFFYTIFSKDSNVYDTVEISDSTVFRIPYIDRETNYNKTLSGDIIIEFEYYVSGKEPFDYDTIKYDFYMVDRALNQSNVESTPDIVFDGSQL